VRLIEAKLFSS